MLRLRREHWEKIIQHAKNEYPNEACGLLGGREGRVEEVYALTNVESSPTGYRLAPEEQFRVMKELEEKGWELVGIYHSHIDFPAYPSPVDVRWAFYPESSYLIISLADRERPVARAFRIVEGKVEEEALVIEE